MMQLHGTITALVTPFTPDGNHVDYEKLRELVEWQINEGVNGLVPVCYSNKQVISLCCI